MSTRPLSFIPGPSKISDAVYRDIETAITEGILELSHRSDAFTTIVEQSLENLRIYLDVPESFAVLYTESATNAWHSMVANAVRERSAHIVTGAFSAKAAAVASKLGKQTKEYSVNVQSDAPDFPTTIEESAELVTICLSESSNGSAWTEAELAHLRSLAPQAIIGVDITSCAGAVTIDMTLADVWYFSVQKAFGLPAGLGVLILSPTAVARGRELASRGQNLAGMWGWDELVNNYQRGRGPTPYTPNMLGIYLLTKQTERLLAAGGLSTVSVATFKKAELLYQYLEQHPVLTPYIPHLTHRSPTVICARAEPADISALHTQAISHRMRLGAGYGELKTTTLRLANFPSITDADISALLAWL